MRFQVLDRDFRTNEHPFWQRVEHGEWESAVIDKLAAVVRSTDIIFDVGAWIGPYSLLLSCLAKEVVSFEPCPFSRQILAHNLTMNGITNVVVEPYALSDREGEEYIYYYNPTGQDDILAASMLNMVDRGEAGAGLSILTTTIDRYCRKHNVTPDGIKIDVEGYESKVLAGCTQSCWKIIELHGAFADVPKVEGELIDGNWNRGHLFVEAVDA